MKRSQLQCRENLSSLSKLKNILGLIIIDDLHDIKKCQSSIDRGQGQTIFGLGRQTLKSLNFQDQENPICVKKKTNARFSTSGYYPMVTETTEPIGDYSPDVAPSSMDIEIPIPKIPKSMFPVVIIPSKTEDPKVNCPDAKTEESKDLHSETGKATEEFKFLPSYPTSDLM